MSLGVTIKGLNVTELKELMLKLREIEQRNPTKVYTANVTGTEHLSREDAEYVIQEVFPKNGDQDPDVTYIDFGKDGSDGPKS